MNDEPNHIVVAVYPSRQLLPRERRRIENKMQHALRRIFPDFELLIPPPADKPKLHVVPKADRAH